MGKLTVSVFWQMDGLGPFQITVLTLTLLVATWLLAAQPVERRSPAVRALTAASLLALACSLASAFVDVGSRHSEAGRALICTGGVWVWKR